MGAGGYGALIDFGGYMATSTFGGCRDSTDQFWGNTNLNTITAVCKVCCLHLFDLLVSSNSNWKIIPFALCISCSTNQLAGSAAYPSSLTTPSCFCVSSDASTCYVPISLVSSSAACSELSTKWATQLFVSAILCSAVAVLGLLMLVYMILF
jgi:hypothetical protein